MITVDWKTDLRTMVRIEKKVEEGVEKSVDEMADKLVQTIRESWYPGTPPSPRGGPPAIVTGNLDSSVMKEDQGRDVMGRFAGKDASVKFVRIDTSKGKDPGKRGNYGHILEETLDRPFVQPAVEKLAAIFPANIKAKVGVR